MAEIDREAVRRDYEAGMSLRALALKYGKGKTTIDKWAKRGQWTVDRGQGGQRDTDQTEQPAESAILHESEPYARLSAMGLRLLDHVGLTLDTGDPVSARDLRALASTLLDVRQLLNAVSPVEAEEQRLRIEGLRREAEQATQTREPVEIKFVETEGAEG